MSVRSILANHNILAVSAENMETAINTEQTLDTSMLCAIGDEINLDRRRENNEDEMTGHEEPDTIYDLGATSSATLNFEKAQPQHFAFLGAYGLGAVASAEAGDGYKHTITPIDGDLDNARSLPSFTAAQRYGKTVLKRRYASMFVDSFTATFSRDSWCKIAGSIKGTGKNAINIVEETVNAAKSAVSLTLAANGVHGASAQERLQNVQRIKVELSAGVWTEVAYSAVSDATPAVITIGASGEGGDLVDYKILYIAAESDWMTLPSRTVETPLRVAQMTLNIGGAWTGSAFSGGRPIGAEMKSLEWSFNNNLEVQFVPGATAAYAGRAVRNGRSQKIKLDREFRDYILQQHMDANDTLGIRILAQGALYDETYHYQVEIIFPKVGFLSAPISVDGKRLAEAGDIQVLEHATYGSVIMNVQNLVETYAA
jgi:hypothetical protein